MEATGSRIGLMIAWTSCPSVSERVQVGKAKYSDRPLSLGFVMNWCPTRRRCPCEEVIRKGTERAVAFEKSSRDSALSGYR